jgi:hypothetical protein
MKSSYQFSEKDMDVYWTLWDKWARSEPMPRSEQQFMFLADEAHRFKCEHKTWPTVAQVLEYVEQKEKEVSERQKRLVEIFAKSKENKQSAPRTKEREHRAK